jgi:Xaa-Pro aminopeptidase
MRNNVSRRNFLLSAAAVGSATAVPATAVVSAAAGVPPAPDALAAQAAPGMGVLLNRDRATDLMRRVGFEALLVSAPMNVYYVTGATPVMSRFTQVNMTAALLPADPKRPIAYFGGGFEYYAGVADAGLNEGVEPYLTGGSLGDPRSTSNPAFAKVGNYRFDARELHRRVLLDTAAPFHDAIPSALQRALRDRSLGGGVIGFDTADAKALLEAASVRASLRPADDFMLHIRLAKTKAELDLMRRACANNVDAALATAKAARGEATLKRIRQRFFEEAAKRGNVGVYGNVDMVMDERVDGALRDGQTFMIDFVSHYGFYQGDYGRTVFFGDPDRQMRRATDVGIAAWGEIQSRLRPGLRFSDIRRIGNETVKKMGAEFTYAFNPHSVGLQHWDQPRQSPDGQPIDLPLEAGMVLSVDCPLLNSGVNGTTHLEDLVLINAAGAEPLHRQGDHFIVV